VGDRWYIADGQALVLDGFGPFERPSWPHGP